MVCSDGFDLAICVSQMGKIRRYFTAVPALVTALMLLAFFAWPPHLAFPADAQPVLRVVTVRYSSDPKTPRDGVTAGGKFFIELSGAPEVEDKLIVEIDKKRAYATPSGTSDDTGRSKEWSVTVPPVGWGKKAMTVSISTRGAEPQPLASNEPEINIYPPAPVVHSIDRVVKLGKVFKVKGEGFLVPRDAIHVSVGGIGYSALEVDPAGTWFTARIPADNRPHHGLNDVTVSVQQPSLNADSAAVRMVPADILITETDVPEERRHQLRTTVIGPVDKSLAAVLALGPLAAAGGLLYMITRKVPHNRAYVFAPAPTGAAVGRGKGWLQMLLVEPANATYSLSWAQFYLWLVVIIYGYSFLMLANWSASGGWSFPKFGGGAYVFMLSLGTLVAAQVTNAATGPKGSGEVYPAVSDLVVHGGVLAPERVQQVLWTLVAAIGFFLTVIGSYSTPTELPTIPTELLVLMGISSAGYIAGKAARGAGPIIDTVIPSTDQIIIRGQQFSKSPRVIVNGTEIKDATLITSNTDPNNSKFANELTVRLPSELHLSHPRVDALSLTVLNEGLGQEAKWTSAPKILSVKKQETELNITTEYVQLNATWEIPDVTEQPTPSSQNQGNPLSWTVAVPPEWPTRRPVTVSVKNPSPNAGTAEFQFPPV